MSSLLTNTYNLSKFFPELDLIIAMRHNTTNVLDNTGIYIIVKRKSDNYFITCFIYHGNNFITYYNSENHLIQKLNEIYYTNQWFFCNYFDVSTVCYGIGENKKTPFWL